MEKYCLRLLFLNINSIGLKSKWVDARSCIKTDQYYRDANVDFEKTSKSIKEKLKVKVFSYLKDLLGVIKNYLLLL